MDIFPKSLWVEREKARVKKKHPKIASGPYLSIQCGKCGAINARDRKECWKCHARFDILEYIPGERHGDLTYLNHLHELPASDSIKTFPLSWEHFYFVNTFPKIYLTNVNIFSINIFN